MAIDYFPGIDQPEPMADRPRPGRKSDAIDKDGFGFFDFLDIINPLQHIPIISSIYRKITGDEISAGARLIGGGLFGGPIGFAAAVANIAVESASGSDIGDHVFAIATGGRGDAELASTQLANPPVFGSGTASGADARSFGNTAPTVGAAAAARNGLFALSLDAPAAGHYEHASGGDTEAASHDLVDGLSSGAGVRVEDLSAEQLVQILTQFQRGTGPSPSLAALPSPPYTGSDYSFRSNVLMD